jgi:hypothetical protein
MAEPHGRGREADVLNAGERLYQNAYCQMISTRMAIMTAHAHFGTFSKRLFIVFLRARHKAPCAVIGSSARELLWLLSPAGEADAKPLPPPEGRSQGLPKNTAAAA